MALQLKSIATTTVVIGFAGLLFLIVWLHESEVPLPAGWPENIRIYRNAVSGMARVVDERTGDTILRLCQIAPEFGRDQLNVYPKAAGGWC